MRLLRRIVLTLAILAAAAGAAAVASPWPSALAIRALFEAGAASTRAAQAPFLPQGLGERTDLAWDAAHPQGRLDLFLPPGEVPAAGWPVVVWVHGGAWVSGSKDEVSNYLRILAGRGVATVGVGYPLSPGARHPEPARHVLRALDWLAAHGAGLGIDPARMVLAGDSAGAQIAAQAGIALTDPGYAARLGAAPALPAGNLRGLVLFCGGMGLAGMPDRGLGGLFIRAVVFAHFGSRSLTGVPDLDLFEIAPNLHAGMPPLFLSVGNADPLRAPTFAVADRAAALGITTDTLFYPPDHQPPLGHEYQFDLTTPEGQAALDRASAFVASVTAP
ncbi:MAG TPA: alpha/beta hydrolase [Paracoccaceae bacterium]|nr:alpha/beta hydrolase [Paracoccaceae bacterium]HMO71151.1 alpha/beta hydrolase [Paracoccaceae bacterium]